MNNYIELFIIYVFFDLIDSFFDLFGRDGTFVAGTQDPGFDLGTVEFFSHLILFDNAQRDCLRFFVGSKTLPAVIAKAASPDRRILIHGSRIYHAGVVIAAIRTFHASKNFDHRDTFLFFMVNNGLRLWQSKYLCGIVKKREGTI